MKAIVNTGPNVLEWRDVPDPTPAPGQVRVRTAACGVCATDLKVMAGPGRGGWPRILGHEWSGAVDAVGDGVEAALVGRRCVAENILSDGGEVGFEHPGGYAEFVITEARNVRTLPDDFPPATAALIEPLAVCVRGLRRLAAEDRSSAVIFGDGAIGLMTLMLLGAEGFGEIVIVGGRPSRLGLALELGASHAINYHDGGDLVGAVRARGIDASPNVVEASGSAAALRAAIEIACAGAKILVLGDYDDARADFPWERVLHRELSIIGSNASALAWPRAVEIATSGRLPLSRLVTKTLPAADFAEAVELTRSSREEVKVVMEWTGHEDAR